MLFRSGFGTSVQQQLTAHKQGSFARQLYVCVGCNTPLFTNKDIVEHSTQFASTSSSAGRTNQSQVCLSYFIKQREWMQSYGTDKTQGVLECYRKVCKRKLGQFSIKLGVRCNCGQHIKPAFQIAKNKVKLVGAQSTQVNLGSSGNSLANLQSNSDLGKYT